MSKLIELPSLDTCPGERRVLWLVVSVPNHVEPSVVLDVGF